MLEFQKFRKEYLENLYSINKIEDIKVSEDYEIFRGGFNESENIAFSILENQGFSLPASMDEILVDNDYASREFEDIMLRSVVHYLEDVYGNERLDDGGICLKSKFIGSACQMIHNKDLLGVVRGYDEKNPKTLFIDFGEEEEVKVHIDELIIAGQKKL